MSLGRAAQLDLRDNKITLTRKKIYILPTRYGLMFGIMVMAMVIGANNYSSNFGFMLAYILAGIGLSAMLQNWRNLHGLEVSTGQSTNVFAGDRAQFQLLLHNNLAKRRGAIACKYDDIESSLDLEANSKQSLCFWAKAPKRGPLKISRIKLFTRYPMGLFYAWSYLETKQSCLVYPRPSTAPSNINRHGGESTDSTLLSGEEPIDYKGHREFMQGDNMKHVDWKAYARKSTELMPTLVKEFAQEQNEKIWLRWDQQSNIPKETQLSELCASVLQMSMAQHEYGLQLPQETISPARGEQHKIRCLSALAMFEN